MRVRKVNRYYCDYCRKAGCHGGHIRKHEARCTLNPHRVCGMCGVIGQPQPNLAALVALLPAETEWDDYDAGLDPAIGLAVDALRQASGGCPACMLAALRQALIPVPAVKEFGFDFDAECRRVWNEVNDRAARADAGYA